MLLLFACAGDGIALEDIPEGQSAGDCSDGADNDGDRLFDCEDNGCDGSPDCADTDSDPTDDTGDTAEPDLGSARPLSQAGAKYAGDEIAAAVGTVVAGPGDLDADGRADVLVGAPGERRGGAIYAFDGSLAGGRTVDDAKWRIGAADGGDGTGTAVAAFDTDDDGLLDLAVGASDDDAEGRDAGAVYVVSHPTGSVDLATVALVFTGDAGDLAGSVLASGGDTNADGLGDLLVGAPGRDGTGGAYLVAPPERVAMSLSNAEARFAGANEGDLAGAAVALGSDLDADGYDDIAIAAPRGDRGGTDAGVVYLFSGPVRGNEDLSDAGGTLLGGASDDAAGTSLAAPGDLDGDGYGDLVVGAPYNDGGGFDSGAAYVMRGPVADEYVLAYADAILTGAAEDDQAGTSVGAGDVDGDGVMDILVGAPGVSTAGEGAGGAFVVLGKASGAIDLADAAAIWLGPSAGAAVGTSIAYAGNTDGDGLGDWLVGGPGTSTDVAGAGAAWLVRGGP